MKKFQVAIAGAGPVGSIAAYFLAQHGIDTVLFEACASCEQDMRASTFHPPTLEMLDSLGIASHLIEQGLKAPIYQYRNRRSGEVFEFDLSELSDMTKFPFRLQCEQYKLSRMLTDRLHEHSHADMHFNSRVVHFEQDDRCVRLSVETPYSLDSFEAEYLIGADGANSLIRKWLGVQFEGFTYPERFLTLSTEWPVQAHFDNLSHVNYLSDPEEWLVLLRVPSVWRILAPVSGDESNEFILSEDKKNEIFSRIVGENEASSVQTNHRTIYSVHQRVANRFDHGRVMLVGDAAHLNNPLGGYGMNSGVHDAWSLCQILNRLIKNGGDRNQALAHFGEQRRSVALSFVQEQTKHNKRSMEESNAEQTRAHESYLKSILLDSTRRREFLLTQSMFSSLRDEPKVA